MLAVVPTVEERARRDIQDAVVFSDEPTVLLDRDLHIVVINRAAASALGVEVSSVVGHDVEQALGSHAYGFTIAKVARGALDRGGKITSRLTASQGQDALSWKVKAQACAFDEQGVAGMVLVGLTVEGPWWHRADHSFVDSQALQSPEEFRILLDLLPDIVFEVDASGRLLYANGMAVELLGFSPQELINRQFVELIHPEERDKFELMVHRTLLGEFVHRNLRYRMIRSDESEFPVEINAIVIQGPDREPRIVGIARDHTQRLLLEQRLRYSEQRYKDLFDSSRDLIFSMDFDGIVLDMNRTGMALTGRPRYELVGTAFEKLLAPETVDAFRRTLDAVRKGSPQDAEVILPGPAGEPRILEIAMAPVWTGRTVSGIHATARDVTHRRKLEQEVQQLHKMESLGRLAAGVAHDFNNILGAVLGFASVLAEGLEKDNRFQPDVTGIIQAARQGSELTRQILSFAQAGSKKKKVVDLVAVVSEVIEMLRRTFPSSISIRFTTSGRPLPVRADPAQIRQVVMNLCVNAKDAMASRGTIFVEVDERPPRDGGGPKVILRVRDQGPGVPDGLSAKIFEPFFTTKSPEQGSGLGLSVCWGIVKDHEGSIRIENASGGGAVFTVMLPEFDAPLEPVVTPGKGVPISRPHRTALVVDDQEVMRRAVGRMLETAGFEVWTASGWQDVARILVTRPQGFDVILLDLTMPEVDGLEVFRRLKGRLENPQVIAVSGYSGRGTAQQILEEGARAFLQKPFSWAELEEALGKLQ